jgi:hypothetical protein
MTRAPEQSGETGNGAGCGGLKGFWWNSRGEEAKGKKRYLEYGGSRDLSRRQEREHGCVKATTLVKETPVRESR